MRRLVFAALALAAAVLAQEPSPRAPIGTRLVDVGSGRSLGELPSAFDGHVVCLGPQHYAADGVDVDAARGHVLVVAGDGCALRDLAGKELWTAKELHLAPRRSRSPWLQPRLCGDRVIVAVGENVLLGLDRSTGAECWRREDCCNWPIDADHELVFAVLRTAVDRQLHAFAIANGAKAFSIDLAASPAGICPAPFGVAIVLPSGVTVIDRAGPESFHAHGTAASVVAGRDLWFVATTDGIVAYDRRGERRWAIELGVPSFDRRTLGVTPDGAPFLLEWCPVSDSGFKVRAFDARDGELSWERTCDGLGVPHSKYWHDCMVDVSDAVVVVTSHAAGGSFAVVLDPKTGGVERRHEAKRG